MSDTVRLRIVVDTGFIGASHDSYIEFGRAEWEGMSKAERERVMDEACQDAISNCIETWWETSDD